ncbi:cell division protein FtsZ [Candidatus Wirthbacteria bacterium CG2_30_54_11]|uniref:Cell division protein FtsZ n=1 Tax=Candidatus Wirthbacteria bacterium CG2_30_54_11 TaxID=1817892 RepID=A0A1J5IHU2_9BACT|nr:MAG: cell division protein FtsZ [Candidatus Wirthbacteria bacterium CG2_30_54_11]
MAREQDAVLNNFAKIKVIGMGGGGNNAVNQMVRLGVKGIDFVAVNTDLQALNTADAPIKLQIGAKVTKGLGSGANPEVGRKACEESREDLTELVKGVDMVFITAGMGGGSGTGGAPVLAEICRQAGVLTVAVVTKPFSFEGARRRTLADQGIRELKQHVDTLIVIPNDRVLQIADDNTSFLDAFRLVDDVLRQGVQGISDLIVLPGLINVDFADVRTIMENAGSALMGIGYGSDDNRAVDAAKAAISSPLLETSIHGAKGVLFNIVGGPDMGMKEINNAAQIIADAADPDANIIFGAVIDENMKGKIKITVIAAGFDEMAERVSAPKEFSKISHGPLQAVDEEELEVPAFLRKNKPLKTPVSSELPAPSADQRDMFKKN